MSEQANDQKRGHGLANDNDEYGNKNRPQVPNQDARIEQHAHRDEEQHGEGISKRQRFAPKSSMHVSMYGRHRAASSVEVGGFGWVR